MEASNFDESNTVLGPPKGMGEDEVRSLHTFRGTYGENGPPVVISKWKPTQQEIDALQAGEGLWLHCLGTTMPPVILTTDNPFETQETS